MAWKVLSDTSMQLDWVWTGAHSGTETEHDGLWSAWKESSNPGSICLISDATVLLEAMGQAESPCFGVKQETMRSALQFYQDRLLLQVSEDKHAIYPSCKVGEELLLISYAPLPVGFTGFLGIVGWFLDGLHAVGMFFDDAMAAVVGFFNLDDDKVGKAQQVIIGYTQCLTALDVDRCRRWCSREVGRSTP